MRKSTAPWAEHGRAYYSHAGSLLLFDASCFDFMFHGRRVLKTTCHFFVIAAAHEKTAHASHLSLFVVSHCIMCSGLRCDHR
jgi:hypothetical protein